MGPTPRSNAALSGVDITVAPDQTQSLCENAKILCARRRTFHPPGPTAAELRCTPTGQPTPLPTVADALHYALARPGRGQGNRHSSPLPSGSRLPALPLRT